MNTRYSVLIATRDRPEDLLPCLRTVLKQDVKDYEVLVADQSTTDASEKAVREEFGDDPRLRYLRTDTAGKSVALNLLLERACGEIFVFTDDDTEVPTNWLRTIGKVMAENPDVDIVFGQVKPGKIPEGITDAWTPNFCFEERRLLRRGEIAGMGANMAMRRSMALRVGHFDPLMGPGAPMPAAEEGDFIYRAYRVGARVMHEPSIQLVHRAWRPGDKWVRVLYGYGIGEAAFAMKHLRCRDWQMIGRLVKPPLYFFARLCYRILCRRAHQEEYFLRGYGRGLILSFRYRVDPRTRLYVHPD